MSFDIDDDIKTRTRLCKKHFSCLKDDGEKLCRVKQCIEGKVYFIECDTAEYCSYQKSFGDSKYCECPVRKEIFNKYGK